MLVITDNLEKLKLEFQHLKKKASQNAIPSTIYRETHTKRKTQKVHLYQNHEHYLCIRILKLLWVITDHLEDKSTIQVSEAILWEIDTSVG